MRGALSLRGALILVAGSSIGLTLAWQRAAPPRSPWRRRAPLASSVPDGIIVDDFYADPANKTADADTVTLLEQVLLDVEPEELIVSLDKVRR